MARERATSATFETGKTVQSAIETRDVLFTDSVSALFACSLARTVELTDEDITETVWTPPDSTGRQYKAKTRTVNRRSQKNGGHAAGFVKTEQSNRLHVLETTDTTIVHESESIAYDESKAVKRSPSVLFIAMVCFAAYVIFNKKIRW